MQSMAVRSDAINFKLNEIETAFTFTKFVEHCSFNAKLDDKSTNTEMIDVISVNNPQLLSQHLSQHLSQLQRVTPIIFESTTSNDEISLVRGVSPLESYDSICNSQASNKRQKTNKDSFSSIDLQSHFEFIPESEKKVFETTWNNRKIALEHAAEVRAMSVFHANQREKRTLEEVIDSALKEYSDMCEKAHVVRLQFEFEKADFTGKMRQTMNDELLQSRDKHTNGSNDSTTPPQWWERYRHQQKDSSDSQEFQYFTQPTAAEVEGSKMDTITTTDRNIDYRVRQHDGHDDRYKSSINTIEDNTGSHMTAVVPTTVASVSTSTTSSRVQRKFNVPIKQKNATDTTGDTTTAIDSTVLVEGVPVVIENQ